MRCAIAFANLLNGDQGINLGGRSGGVTQEFLDNTNIGAAIQEMSCEGMAQGVRTHLGF